MKDCSTSSRARSARGRSSSSAPREVLVCRAERLAFPLRDGVPMMLEEDARQLTPDDPLLER